MAKLGEVLGGLLTDVVRARMAADLVTAQAVETYRADPSLASLSVPRVTVSNLTVKLNFAVSGVSTPAPAPIDLRRARAEWTSRAAERVLPLLPVRRTAAARLASTEPPPVVPDVPLHTDYLEAGVAGDVEPLVEATMSHFMEGRGRITRALRDDIAAEVRVEALAYADSLRQQQFSDASIRSTMDVDIVADKVSAAQPETLQSLEVTFSVDDIEEILEGPSGQIAWR